MQVVLKRDFFAPNGHLYQKTQAAHLGATTYVPSHVRVKDQLVEVKLPADAELVSRDAEYIDEETGEEAAVKPTEEPVNANEQMSISEFAKQNGDHSLDKVNEAAAKQQEANETEQAARRAEFRKRLAERQAANGSPAAPAVAKKGKSKGK